MTEKGHFIVLEGIDGAGKKTQTELLFSRLQSMGYSPLLADFPAYNTPFGDLVAKYLKGYFGKMDEVPFEIRCMLYAADRYQFAAEYERTLKSGINIICNRYSSANWGFQTTEFEGKEWQDDLKWLQEIES